MWLLFGLPLAVLGIDMYSASHDGVPVGQALFHFVLLRLTSAVPNGLLAVSIAAVPIGAMYWILDRQFRKSELLRAYGML